jgi:hypothetical protein
MMFSRHYLSYFLIETTFSRLDSVWVLRMFTQLGPIDRASAYLRTNIIFSRQILYIGVRYVAGLRCFRAEVASVSEKYISITIEAHRITGGLV